MSRVPVRWDRESGHHSDHPDGRYVTYKLIVAYEDGSGHYPILRVMSRSLTARRKHKYHVKWELTHMVLYAGTNYPEIPTAPDGGLLELPLEQLKSFAWTYATMLLTRRPI